MRPSAIAIVEGPATGRRPGSRRQMPDGEPARDAPPPVTVALPAPSFAVRRLDQVLRHDIVDLDLRRASSRRPRSEKSMAFWKTSGSIQSSPFFAASPTGMKSL